MTKDTRDQRDPQKLGQLISTYRQLSDNEAPWDLLVNTPVPNYDDGGHISNDPALHHSKTPQTDNERIHPDAIPRWEEEEKEGHDAPAD